MTPRIVRPMGHYVGGRYAKPPQSRAAREAKKRYRLRHPERVKASNRTHYERNRATILERVAQWNAANKLQRRVYQRVWKRMKRLRVAARTA